MQLEVVDQLVSFQEACRLFLMCPSQQEVNTVIQTRTSVSMGSKLVVLLALAMVHHKCMLNNSHIPSNLEQLLSTTVILPGKDMLALVHISRLPIHNNTFNPHHMVNLHNQCRVQLPCLASH